MASRKRKLSPAALKKRRAAVLRKNVRKLGKEGLRARALKAAATRKRRELASFGDKDNDLGERADLAFDAFNSNLGYLPDNFYSRIREASTTRATRVRLTVGIMDESGEVGGRQRIFIDIPEDVGDEATIRRLIYAGLRAFTKTGGKKEGESDPGSALLVYRASFAADY